MTRIDEIVNRLFPDSGEFSDKTFMSSSYDSSKSFGGNVKVEIEPVNKHAKIDGVSVYKDAEAEVLIRPNTKFEVVKKEKNADGSWNIKLREKA